LCALLPIMDVRPQSAPHDPARASVTPPSLRELPGWRSLDEHELASRVTRLLDAGLSPQPIRAGSRPMHQVPAATAESPQSARPSPGPQPAAPMADGLHPDTVQQWARLTLGLPWVALATALALSAPILVWAPLLGGLCLGLAGLQFGLTRRWLQQGQALASGHQRAAIAPRPAAAQRRTPAGVLLLSWLVLLGLLAGIVLFSRVQQQDQPPPSTARAPRAASDDVPGPSPANNPAETAHEPQHPRAQ
jgi:uncharacterized protein HemX